LKSKCSKDSSSQCRSYHSLLFFYRTLLSSLGKIYEMKN
jgi:hypothetical protein